MLSLPFFVLLPVPGCQSNARAEVFPSGVAGSTVSVFGSARCWDGILGCLLPGGTKRARLVRSGPER